jgi:hypothetical protein
MMKKKEKNKRRFEMWKWLLGIIMMGIFILGEGQLFAQKVKYKSETVYDFEDDIVEGDLVRPDGEMAVVRRKARTSTLIRVRKHFIPEMLKSVENL